MSVLKNYAFSLLLLAGIALGGLFGVLLGDETVVVKPIGDLFLNMMFVLIVPLVFFSVSSAICSLKQNGQMVGGLITSIIAIFVITAIVAALLAYLITLFYNPFNGLSISDLALNTMSLNNFQPQSTGEMFVNTLTVSDFPLLFTKNNLLPLILFSILFGTGVSSVGKQGEQLAHALHALSSVIIKMMNLIMYAAPIGLGCYFAYTVGQLGGQLLDGYVNAFLLYLVLAAVSYFILNSLYAYISAGKKGFVSFWNNIINPSLTAVSTASSAACIPSNIEASKKIGVPNHIAETVIPLGTNVHKDGSVMGGILKIVFLISIFGAETPLASNIFIIIGMAILVGAVMGAIPSGGMTGELLICSVFGFPPEMVGALMIISTIIDIPATLVNSTGNVACSMLVARLSVGKDWIEDIVHSKK